MKIEEKFIKNQDIAIHYTTSSEQTNSRLTPLLICPGLSESSNEYRKVIEDLWPRKVVAISFRGRLKSESPLSGYGLDEHLSDIETVVKDLNWDHFYIMGYSRGVSYALGYAIKSIHRIKGLILIDYPAEHKKMTEGWAEEFLNSYKEYFGVKADIEPRAIKGIEVESEHYEFWEDLSTFDFPVLVMNGERAGSALSEEQIKQYKAKTKYIKVVGFANSGHNLRDSEYGKYIKTIKGFIL